MINSNAASLPASYASTAEHPVPADMLQAASQSGRQRHAWPLQQPLVYCHGKAIKYTKAAAHWRQFCAKVRS